jgi:hypothetical protein
MTFLAGVGLFATRSSGERSLRTRTHSRSSVSGPGAWRLQVRRGESPLQHFAFLDCDLASVLLTNKGAKRKCPGVGPTRPEAMHVGRWGRRQAVACLFGGKPSAETRPKVPNFAPRTVTCRGGGTGSQQGARGGALAEAPGGGAEAGFRPVTSAASFPGGRAWPRRPASASRAAPTRPEMQQTSFPARSTPPA